MATHEAPAAQAQALPTTPAVATALTPPQIGQPWPEHGGTYIGIASDLPGGDVGHLILLDAKPASAMSWANAKKWACKQGDEARLPTRAEALLIFANAKKSLTPSYHWTCEKFDASSAWNCDFTNGSQDTTRKYDELAAVAVRRLTIQSFNPLTGGAA